MHFKVLNAVMFTLLTNTCMNNSAGSVVLWSEHPYCDEVFEFDSTVRSKLGCQHNQTPLRLRPRSSLQSTAPSENNTVHMLQPCLL